MSAYAKQIDAAQVEPSGHLPYAPSAMQTLAFLRLTRFAADGKKWQFAKADRGVLVLKPKGAEWHLVGPEGCDCAAYGWKRACWHSTAVMVCGGWESVSELIGRFP